jgi:sugar phosphate isomerase/epimerase
MSKLFIQPDSSNFDDFLEYARENDYNLEIASFAFAKTLDSNWKEILVDYQKKLRDFKGIISIHGAFQDLILHSRDNKISETTKSRYIQNLEIAKAMNAKYIVFHGNFNPLITHESYILNWIEQNARFWRDAISKYDITILIENVWEPSPEIFRKLLDEVNSPLLKICFDTGHKNIFSKVPAGQWFESLANEIDYIHVNDNNGDTDNELVPGDGNINWKEFSDNIKKYNMTPDIVFEVGTLEKTKQSIKYFKESKIYPFNMSSKKIIQKI